MFLPDSIYEWAQEFIGTLSVQGGGDRTEEGHQHSASGHSMVYVERG